MNNEEFDRLCDRISKVPTWHDTLLLPDKLGYPAPCDVTVEVEAEIQGQTTRSTYPAEYIGGRKNKWRIWYREHSSRPLAENERVTHWMVRS